MDLEIKVVGDMYEDKEALNDFFNAQHNAAALHRIEEEIRRMYKYGDYSQEVKDILNEVMGIIVRERHDL